MSQPFVGDQSPAVYAESLGYSAVYTLFGKLTHFARDSGRPEIDRLALCHIRPRWPLTWFGTGNQMEIDRAEAQPLCDRCLERLSELEESETSLRVEEHG